MCQQLEDGHILRLYSAGKGKNMHMLQQWYHDEMIRAYMSPSLEVAPCKHKGGMGVYATSDIKAGTLLIVWGGTLVRSEELRNMSDTEWMHSVVQVDEELYLATMGEKMHTDCINHSCDPNAGLSGSVQLVALRSIRSGEEVCYDYAMTDGRPYCGFLCTCGIHGCRRTITGDDWKNPLLWERYHGYFSPYLQRRIDVMKAGGTVCYL